MTMPRMIKPALLLFTSILFIGHGHGADHSLTPGSAGYLITKEGRMISFTGVVDKYSRVTFVYGPEEKETTIPWTQFRKINFDSSTAFKAWVMDRKGREFEVTRMLTVGRNRGPSFYYTYWDDVAEKLTEGSVGTRDVEMIVFGENFGPFRSCPSHGGAYPSTFLFCPIDGSATVWAEPFGDTKDAVNVRAISLARIEVSDLDPRLRSRALRLAVDTINPFASEADITAAVDSLVAEILNAKP